jgi:hypothetical protein
MATFPIILMQSILNEGKSIVREWLISSLMDTHPGKSIKNPILFACYKVFFVLG